MNKTFTEDYYFFKEQIFACHTVSEIVDVVHRARLVLKYDEYCAIDFLAGVHSQDSVVIDV